MIRVGTRYYDLALGPAPLPRPCASCGRAEGHATRTWMAPTVIGAPLFVFGDACTYKCAWCGTEMVAPPPRGAAPLPIQQRFGGAFLVAFALFAYGVWFVGDKAFTAYEHYRSDRALAAAPTASDDGEATKLASVKAEAKKALDDAEAAEKSCMSALLAAKPDMAADAAFWARTNIPTTPSRALAETPYYGFDSLASARDNASSVGGFACKVKDKTFLSQMLAASITTVADFEPLVPRVRAQIAACVPPPVVVVSKGGCKTDKHWCRVGLFWVEPTTKKVTAAVTEDAPWKGEDANEPGTRAAMDRVRQKLVSWKSASP